MGRFRLSGASRCLWISALTWIATGSFNPSLANTEEIPVEITSIKVDVDVDDNGLSTKIFHRSSKARNDAAIGIIGQEKLPYSESMEELTILEAYTLKANGEKIPVDTSAIFARASEGSAGMTMFDDIKQKVIVFPDVSVGDSVVYKAKYRDKKAYIPGHFWVSRYFPPQIPVRESHLRLTIPKSFAANHYSNGPKLKRTASGKNVVFTVDYRVDKATNDPSPMVSPLSKMPKILISSFESYEQLGRTYAQISLPKAMPSDAVRKLAAEIVKNTSDRRRRAQLIYEWVGKNIRYVAINLGQGGLIPHDADTVLRNRYGDCKDKMVLFTALLDSVGIKSEFVLIDAGNEYQLSPIPTFAGLNHAISYLPEFDLYADTTSGLVPFGSLSFSEYGKPVIHAVASGTVVRKIPVLPPGKAKISTKTVARLNPDGTLAGSTVSTGTGPYSASLRLIGYGIQALGPTASVKKLMEMSGFENPTGKFTAPPPREPGPDYALSGEFSVGGWKEVASGKRATYMPAGLRLVGPVGEGAIGPFVTSNVIEAQESVCQSVDAIEEVSLTLPAGKKLDRAVPQDVSIKTANVTYSAKWKLEGRVISVRRELSSRFSEPICSGTLRRQMVQSIKTITESYDTPIAVIDETESSSEPVAAPQSSDEPPQSAPPPQKGAQSPLILGTIAAMRGKKWPEAIQYATAALSDASISGDYKAYSYYWRGTSRTMLGMNDEALADFNAAIAMKPDFAAAFMGRGYFQFRLTNYEKAFEDYNHAIKLQPYSLDAYLGRASVYLKTGRTTEALSDLEQAIKINPTDPRIFVIRAEVYRSLGQKDKEGKDYAEIARVMPEDRLAQARHGDRLLREGRNDEAIDAYSKAIAMEPQSSSDAYAFRAVAYVRLRKFDQAVDDLSKAVKLTPGNIELYLARCDALTKAGDADDAIDDCDKALSINPRSFRAYGFRAAAHFRLRKYSKAISDYDRALAADTNNAIFLYGRGLAKNKSGDVSGARSDIGKALTAKPSVVQDFSDLN